MARICYNYQVFTYLSMTAKQMLSPRAAWMLAGALACVLLPVVAAAQQTPPLAEIARKEAERRKGIKESQKVITTKDLPESARKPRSTPDAPATGAEQAPAHAGDAQKPAGDAQKPAGAETQKPEGQRDEAYWRTRITQTRESVRRNEAFAEALQSRINALTTDFVNRDDPYQRAKIGEDRQKALDELARVKNEIEQSRKQVEDVEEEARKAGVPPGWLR
jgi:hypothetical protein